MSETNYWSRTRRQRLSRRTLLGASARAGVGAAGLALVGCGDDDDDDVAVAQIETPDEQQAAEQAAEQAEQQAAAEEPAEQEEQAVAQAMGITRGGTLRLSSPLATHDYFDPHRAVFGPTAGWMGHYMNYVIRWRNKEKGVLEADIASLPEIPDEETYVFSVDQGARYWDQFPTEGGRLVTADDIRWNVQRQIDAVDADGAEDGTFLLSTRWRLTDSMSVIDEQTIQFKTDGPNATYLDGAFGSPFGWMTSPEAGEEFGNRWRDETVNIELSSGTGPHIPVSYDPDTQLRARRNPDYWKNGSDGAALPYKDNVEWNNLTDPVAVEASYRAQQIDMGGFPLSKLQVDGIAGDFPEHTFNQIAFGFTIVNAVNYNPNWEGEDGNGNPWLDRRVAAGFSAAIDRFLMIDTVYLGDARLTADAAAPWFDEFWALPADEVLTIPGYRPDREADIAYMRQMLDAAGLPADYTFRVMVPDLWEATYPGITETSKAMYEEATERSFAIEVQPYTVILQRLSEGTYPGAIPAWTNPPSVLDPTGGWNNTILPGGSGPASTSTRSSQARTATACPGWTAA